MLEKAVTAAENVKIWDVFGNLLFSCSYLCGCAATLQRQKTRRLVEDAPIQILEPSELRCLVRATDGKQKISCSVSSPVLNLLSSSNDLLEYRINSVLFSFPVCMQLVNIAVVWGSAFVTLEVWQMLVWMFAAHSQESLEISNLICHSFEGTYGLFEEERKERQEREKIYCCPNPSFLITLEIVEYLNPRAQFA